MAKLLKNILITRICPPLFHKIYDNIQARGGIYMSEKRSNLFKISRRLVKKRSKIILTRSNPNPKGIKCIKK